MGKSSEDQVYLQNVIRENAWGQVKEERQTEAGSREALKSILGVSVLTIQAIGRLMPEGFSRCVVC